MNDRVRTTAVRFGDIFGDLFIKKKKETLRLLHVGRLVKHLTESISGGGYAADVGLVKAQPTAE